MDTPTPSMPLDTTPMDTPPSNRFLRWLHEYTFLPPEDYTLPVLHDMMDRVAEIEQMRALDCLHPISHDVLPPPSVQLGPHAALALHTLFFQAWSPVDAPIAPDTMVLPDAVEMGIADLVSAGIVATQRLPAGRRFRPLVPFAAIVRLFHQAEDADPTAFAALRAVIDEDALVDILHDVEIAYVNGWFDGHLDDAHTPSGLARLFH